MPRVLRDQENAVRAFAPDKTPGPVALQTPATRDRRALGAKTTNLRTRNPYQTPAQKQLETPGIVEEVPTQTATCPAPSDETHRHVFDVTASATSTARHSWQPLHPFQTPLQAKSLDARDESASRGERHNVDDNGRALSTNAHLDEAEPISPSSTSFPDTRRHGARLPKVTVEEQNDGELGDYFCGGIHIDDLPGPESEATHGPHCREQKTLPLIDGFGCDEEELAEFRRMGQDVELQLEDPEEERWEREPWVKLMAEDTRQVQKMLRAAEGHEEVDIPDSFEEGMVDDGGRIRFITPAQLEQLQQPPPLRTSRAVEAAEALGSKPVPSFMRPTAAALAKHSKPADNRRNVSVAQATVGRRGGKKISALLSTDTTTAQGSKKAAQLEKDLQRRRQLFHDLSEPLSHRPHLRKRLIERLWFDQWDLEAFLREPVAGDADEPPAFAFPETTAAGQQPPSFAETDELLKQAQELPSELHFEEEWRREQDEIDDRVRRLIAQREEEEPTGELQQGKDLDAALSAEEATDDGVAAGKAEETLHADDTSQQGSDVEMRDVWDLEDEDVTSEDDRELLRQIDAKWSVPTATAA